VADLASSLNIIIYLFICLFFLGGTLDVSAHHIQENGALREIFKATGGNYGGQNVNRQFRNLLESIFTQTFIENYARQNPSIGFASWRLLEGQTTRVLVT